MHALDWLNEPGHILRGAFQPIEGAHFYRFRSRGLCDLALTNFPEHRDILVGGTWTHKLDWQKIEFESHPGLGMLQKNHSSDQP